MFFGCPVRGEKNGIKIFIVIENAVFDYYN